MTATVRETVDGDEADGSPESPVMTKGSAAETPAAETPAAETSYASWPSRAGAFSLDVLFGLGVFAAATLVWLSAPPEQWLWWVCVVVAAVSIISIVVNRWWLPTTVGWSLGRGVAGIAVMNRDGSSASFVRLVARDVLHLVDTAALLIGWLWPLVDSRRRTFADLLARTEVRRAAPGRQVRRVAAVMTIASVVLCGVLVSLGYLAVYRPVQVAHDADREIGDQGPRIVSDMLSYSAASLQADFSRAQSLVTDGYRPQLVAQQQTVQQAVQKVGPATNEYWVASSSVLSATPDRASLLLFMQGQRSAGQQPPRFISATVRATFERSPDGHWLVADLTPLTKPEQPEKGK